MSQKLGELFY